MNPWNGVFGNFRFPWVLPFNRERKISGAIRPKTGYPEKNGLEGTILWMCNFVMDNSRLDFKELISHLESQQEWAVRELVERYGHHVLRVVRRHLGRKLRVKFDSDDFLQAVWATLLVKSTAFQDIETEDQLVKFLTRIAFHKVIDQRRAYTLAERRDMRREVPLPEHDSQFPDLPTPQSTPSEYLMAEEDWELIQQEIPLELQWMIECRIEGMTYAEIADQAGLHERTVRRVFERLRRKIADQ